MRFRAANKEAKRNMLKKHIVTSISAVMSLIVRYRPQLIVGMEQGVLITVLSTSKLLAEITCRLQITTSQELTGLRAAWGHLVGVIAINPWISPQTWSQGIGELLSAIPEISWRQPGRLPLMIASHMNCKGNGCP